MKFDAFGYHPTSGITVYEYNSSHVLIETASIAGGGEFLWTTQSNTTGLTFVDPPPLGGSNLMTFCLEINQNIYYPPSGPYSYSVVDLQDAPNTGAPVGAGTMGTDAAVLIRELWAYAQVGAIGTNFLTAAAQNAEAGAIQLAIWKIEYDHAQLMALGAGNLTAANFNNGGLAYLQVTNTSDSMVTRAIALINAVLHLDPSTAPQANLVALTSLTWQDQVTEVVNSIPHIVPVPEPASLAIWGMLGLVGVACRRRRTCD